MGILTLFLFYRSLIFSSTLSFHFVYGVFCHYQICQLFPVSLLNLVSWLESSSHPWLKKYSSIFFSNILELLCVFIFPSSCNLKSSLSTHGHQDNYMFIWRSSHKVLESQGTSEVTQKPESLIVTLSFWERAKDFNLAYKALRIHPDFSLEGEKMPGGKMPITLLTALELLNQAKPLPFWSLQPHLPLLNWFWIFLELSCIHALAQTLF